MATAEDKPVDGTQEKQAATQESVKPKAVEKDFSFDGDAMDKFVEQIKLDEKSGTADVKASETKEVGEKPCPGCEKDKETRTPIRIIKVKGKDIPLYSEDEVTKYAQLGVNATQMRQDDARWEESLRQREERLAQLQPALGKILEHLQKGGNLKELGVSEVGTGTEEAVDESEILDPDTRKYVKKLEDKIAGLEQRTAEGEKVTMSAKYQQAKGMLEGMVVEAKKEFPFEEIIDEETGANVSEETFGGLVSFKVNADLMRAKQDPTFKVRTMQEVVRDAARGLSLMGSKAKGNGGAEITETSLKEKHPEIVKSIEQNAIAGYLREQQGLPPSVRGKSGDAASAAQTAGDGKDKKWGGIDDAFDAAEKDKGLMSEVIGEISKTYRR